MNDIVNHTINLNEPISKALEKLNLPFHLKTVFVINEKNQVLGTITDGDIRRGLLNGIDFSEKCEKFAYKDFKFLQKDNISIEQLIQWREKQIYILPLLNDNKELIEILNFNELKSFLPLTAVIMAGGFGNRLRPLTQNTPKPMLKIGEFPILEVNIKRLVQYGIREIFICVNYLKEQIMEYFEDGTKWGCNIHYIQEDQPLGTIGALALIQQIQHQLVLLFNADLLSNIDFEDMYCKHVELKSSLSIASIPHKITLPYAVLEGQNHLITSISEKPTYTYFANAGFYLFDASLMQKIPKDKFYNATDFVDDLINSQFTVSSFPIHGYWSDIGSIEDYKKSNEDFPNLNFF